jgi:hypothetical protein
LRGALAVAFGKGDTLCLADRLGARNMAHAS